MRILLTNDDGINAQGLRELAFTLKKMDIGHEIVVIAPNEERSAVSHSLTIRTPLKYEKANSFESIEAYAINGTPADCVKFGVSHILKEPPDIVISGINHGQNLGTDVIYSGTVSAAFEARFLGFKAMAVSCYGINKKSKDIGKEFCHAANFIANNLKKLVEIDLPRHTILNINHPNTKGTNVKITPLGVQEYDDVYVVDAAIADMYWLTGRPIKHEKNPENCDVEWAYKNVVTITPITFDFTNYKFLQQIEKDLDIFEL